MLIYANKLENNSLISNLFSPEESQLRVECDINNGGKNAREGSKIREKLRLGPKGPPCHVKIKL